MWGRSQEKGGDDGHKGQESQTDDAGLHDHATGGIVSRATVASLSRVGLGVADDVGTQSRRSSVVIRHEDVWLSTRSGRSIGDHDGAVGSNVEHAAFENVDGGSLPAGTADTDRSRLGWASSVGQEHQDGTLAKGDVVLVPLQELEVATEELIAFSVPVRGDEVLADLVELLNVEIGGLGHVIVAVLGGPQGRSVVLWRTTSSARRFRLARRA